MQLDNVWDHVKLQISPVGLFQVYGNITSTRIEGVSVQRSHSNTIMDL